MGNNQRNKIKVKIKREEKQNSKESSKDNESDAKSDETCEKKDVVKDAKSKVKDALDNINLPKMPKIHKPAFMKKKNKEGSDKVKFQYLDIQTFILVLFSGRGRAKRR